MIPRRNFCFCHTRANLHSACSFASSGRPPSAGVPPFSATHPPESTEYEAGLTVVGEFDTAEEFCQYFNWLKPPLKLEKNSNYNIFKLGIKTMWEDSATKWVC